MTTNYKIPTSGILSFDYVRREPGTNSSTDIGHIHKGIDLPAKEGTPVYSLVDGTIEHASNIYKTGFSGYGRVVVIKDNNSNLRFLYAHLLHADVNEGDKVIEGDKIGEVGRTGFTKTDNTRLISGPHLHFEITENHKYPLDSHHPAKINPATYLQNTGKHPFNSTTADTDPQINLVTKNKNSKKKSC